MKPENLEFHNTQVGWNIFTKILLQLLLGNRCSAQLPEANTAIYSTPALQYIQSLVLYLILGK